MPSPDHCPRLPRIVDALKLCQQGVHVTGFVEFTQLSRLEGLLSTPEGQVSVDIHFAIDEQHRKILSGRIAASVPLVCQRCLGKMMWPLDGGFELALVWNEEQAAQLPRTLDPVMVEDTELDIFSVVEDEILLALPLVSHHDIGTCTAPSVANPALPVETVEVRKNPFQVLASLKTGGDPRNKNESGE